MGRCIQEYLILYLKSKYIHIYITDCISANGQTPFPTSLLYMSLKHLVASLKPWRYEEGEVFFIAITPRSTQTQSDNTFQGPRYVHF